MKIYIYIALLSFSTSLFALQNGDLNGIYYDFSGNLEQWIEIDSNQIKIEKIEFIPSTV